MSVTLPKGEQLDNAHIGTVCRRVEFAADHCPADSLIGHAKVMTPLLDEPLEGNVYLRASSHKLPDLVMDLEGQVDIELVGRVDTVNGRLRTTFESVPDAPVTSVTLDLLGGAKGLLVNSESLCGRTKRATVRMTGQNGEVVNAKPKLKTSCGSGASHKRHRLQAGEGLGGADPTKTGRQDSRGRGLAALSLLAVAGTAARARSRSTPTPASTTTGPGRRRERSPSASDVAMNQTTEKVYVTDPAATGRLRLPVRRRRKPPSVLRARRGDRDLRSTSKGPQRVAVDNSSTASQGNIYVLAENVIKGYRPDGTEIGGGVPDRRLRGSAASRSTPRATSGESTTGAA